MFENEDEVTAVIRHHNRVLRKVNKVLRSSQKTSQDYSDSLFRELCEHDNEAEIAMEKLRTLGGFSCGPRDYEFIVAACLKALANPIDHS